MSNELTALFSYIDPPAHLEAAFFRICGALVPIGLLGMAMLCRGSPPHFASIQVEDRGEPEPPRC